MPIVLTARPRGYTYGGDTGTGPATTEQAMSGAAKKAKFTFGQLALVDWLLESPDTRFVVENAYYNCWKELSLYEIADGETRQLSGSSVSAEPEFLDRLGGSVEIDTTKLVADRAVLAQHSLHKREGGDKNGFALFMESVGMTQYVSDTGYRLLRAKGASSAWWEETGRALFEAMKKKRDDTREAVGRTIVIGTWCRVQPKIDPVKARAFPVGFKLPIPELVVFRPTFTATVVKESKDRLYVQNVVRLRGETSYLLSSEETVVRGRAPKQFVERRHVMADGVGEGGPKKMLAVDAERIESYHEACDKALAAALDPLLNFYARQFQAESMHDDLMREAVEADKKAAN